MEWEKICLKENGQAHVESESQYLKNVTESSPVTQSLNVLLLLIDKQWKLFHF